MKTFFVLSFVSLICGCASAQMTVANPSAVLCADLGGQSQPLNVQAGAIALCMFGNAGIEEWTLYRQKNGTPTQVVSAFFNPKLVNAVIVNPRGKKIADEAVTYCGLQGGAIVKAANPSGYLVELCQFPDNSAMSKETFYRGAGHPDNAALTTILQ